MTALQGEGYAVDYNADTGTIRITGILRLGGIIEYQPISELLENSIAAHPALTLDLSGLEFLNSSGIATLSKFVITARNHQGCAITIRGSSSVPWQGKSLNNLKRLMPDLTLTFD